jgi:hypothetical protein
MPMDRLSLMRCVELFQFPLERRLRKIKQDARKSLVKELPGDREDGGGDFYSEFWADAKEKVANDDFDLFRSTYERITKNKSKRRLYPILLNGFAKGWDTIRERLEIKGKFSVVRGITTEIEGSSKTDSVVVKNTLTIRTEDKRLHIIYPYFSKDVALGARHAGMAIAAMQEGFEKTAPDNIVIFDVLRGTVFFDKEADLPPGGSSVLIERYDAVMREWRTQRRLLSRGW